MAGSINKVILVGRLGQDPKLTYLPSGAPVAEFSLATDESYKNREGQKVEQTEWHRVKVFGRSAEFCGNYLSKGRLVYVEGQLRTRSWEDQQGQKRYITEVVVSAPGHTIQGLDSRGGASAAPSEYEQGGYGGPRSGPQGGGQRGAPAQRQQRPSQDPGPEAFPSEASGMDDVPF
ncbi:single-stranded DNA-binding protein [Fundidesulfovibrio butyratiphilus]